MKFYSSRAFFLCLALCFMFNCAGPKSEQRPAPPVEEKKVESTKGEEVPPPPPVQGPSPPRHVEQPPVSPPVPEDKKTPLPPPPPSQPTRPTPPIRMTKILWESVNFREGPGLDFKVIGTGKKGTVLAVIEEKGNWLKVRLEDGKEVWVSKLATSEAPPLSPAKPSKPKPM